VIIHGNQRTALLRERSTGKMVRAESGREVNGMKVAEIRPESVTLALGDEREELSLIVQKGPAATPGAAAHASSSTAAGGPFARPAGSLPNPAQAAAAAAAAGQVPPGTPQPPAMAGSPMPATPGATPPFGPLPATANAPPGANNPSPPQQAGPAFPMTPEELLARRRARRAQQNQ
jgi:hypothetical protein